MNKKVLCVAVHADDETLGCGGTLLKHVVQGDDVYWLLLTGPTLDHPHNFTKDHIAKRAMRVENVAKKFGIKLIYLEFPTQLLHALDLRDMIKKIDAVIKEVQPNIIYTMFSNDVHSDHRFAFDALYSCTKSFRKPFIEAIYMMETLSETEFAPALPSTSFIPNVYVDISPYMEKKLEIMKLYESEIMDEPYPRSLSSIEALARVRGSRCGVKYAEAFMLLYEKK